jgi:hypothetical protein
MIDNLLTQITVDFNADKLFQKLANLKDQLNLSHDWSHRGNNDHRPVPLEEVLLKQTRKWDCHQLLCSLGTTSIDRVQQDSNYDSQLKQEDLRLFLISTFSHLCLSIPQTMGEIYHNDFDICI